MTPPNPSPLSRRQFLVASAIAGAGLASLGASPALTANPWIYSPILMYHYVDYLPPNPDIYRTSLTVSPEMFGAHLDALNAGGYTVITMAQLWAGLSTGAQLPPKPVVLTFDDGYDNAYRFAYPALVAHGMTGMFNLITGQVGQWGYVTWPQVVEMAGAGMEIGNHTVHHPDLWHLGYADRLAEIDGAAKAIADNLGRRPQFFCYPIGHYNVYIADIVKRTGHLAATTTQYGTLHSATYPYWMHRVRVDNTVTAQGLLNLLDAKV